MLTLKALTYQPTGGIVAALTTSLPEQIGGPRNWDYRYCWLRDATLTLQAMLAAGYVDEARPGGTGCCARSPATRPTCRSCTASTAPAGCPRYELPWLAGYEGSAPVRVGNAAAEQLQLDVWGEALDGLSFARQAGLSSNDDAWDLQIALLDYLGGAWTEPDNGLWEMRGAAPHFVHSKVMAWVAFDRMVARRRAVPAGRAGRPVAGDPRRRSRPRC